MAPRNRRRRRGRGNTNSVVPVANTVFLTQPSASIPLTFSLSGSGDLAVVLPSYLNGVAWKVTSLDASFAATSPSTCIIRIFGAIANNTTTSAVEIVARSRAFLVHQAPIQIKFRTGRSVQHGASNSGVDIVQFGVGSTSIIIDGVINLSTKGGL